jgi:hypothetical protein
MALTKVKGSVVDLTKVNVADYTFNGLMSATDKVKLDGIEASSKDDQTPSELLADLITVAGSGSSLDADLLDGYHGSYYTDASQLDSGTIPAARFNNTSHGSRGGGSLHAVATQSIAGFMSASDKVIVDAVGSAGLLVGEVKTWPTSTPPTGWLECSGAALDTTTYALLFASIGYTWGGAGASFNLPDFRGSFLRGWDHGRGLDTGRVFGTYQADDNKSHAHEYQAAVHNAWKYGNNGTYNLYGGGTVDDTGYLAPTETVGAVEARPKNYTVLYIIYTGI